MGYFKEITNCLAMIYDTSIKRHLKLHPVSLTRCEFIHARIRTIIHVVIYANKPNLLAKTSYVLLGCHSRIGSDSPSNRSAIGQVILPSRHASEGMASAIVSAT